MTRTNLAKTAGSPALGVDVGAEFVVAKAETLHKGVTSGGHQLIQQLNPQDTAPSRTTSCQR